MSDAERYEQLTGIAIALCEYIATQHRINKLSKDAAQTYIAVLQMYMNTSTPEESVDAFQAEIEIIVSALKGSR